MDMTGEHRIDAPRAKVWAALNDPEVLRQAIPGCEEVEKTSDTEFAAKVMAKVGPVKARFAGKVTLSDIDPPNGYTISGEGTGGAAGFAKGGATVKLTDDGAATLLSYAVTASVGGKLAQIGSRLIDGTARKLAEEFFGKFAEIVAVPAEAPAEAVEAAAPAVAEDAAIAAAAAPTAGPPAETPSPALEPADGGLHPALWITGVVIVVGLLLWYFTRD